MRGMRMVPARWGGLAALVCALSCGVAVAAGEGQPAETRRMAERLQKITVELDPQDNPFVNARRAELLGRMIAEQGKAAPPPLIREHAQELLYAGRTAEAITRFDLLMGMMKASGLDARSKPWVDLMMRRAVASLRRGEEENCILHHNARSCMFPIRGSGIHQQTRGSRDAAKILGDVLAQDPNHLGARWLLNIAYMTLGQYPDGVPPRQLLAPSLFQAEYDIKPFPDIAGEMGLDVDDLAGGSVIEDFDGDGYLDIMASGMGMQSQLRYFHNDADGTFGERTAAAQLTGELGGLNIIQTDYNNDGRPDVLVLRGGWMGPGGKFPNSLLRNDGAGAFTDVTERAGLLSFHPTQTGVWSDLDNDGWLDLFIGNESAESEVHPSELYRNNGDGTFTECARAAGLAAVGYIKAVVAGDYNNDLRPDIYVSIHGGKNLLYRNDGPSGAPGAGKGVCGLRFSEVAAAARVTEPHHSFPAWFWDYDNDGWEDIFVSGFILGDLGDVAADYLGQPHRAELPRLYRNNHDGTFSDVTKAARLSRVLLSMGSNYGDLDNDGWLDFLVGTGNPELSTLLPDRAFRNAGGRFFQDVTTSGGFGHLQKGHGVAFGDLDNDGDQDIYHVVGGAFEADHFRNALYHNPGHGNHWLALKLEGVKSNRPGIGARLKVVVREGGGERAIYKTVRSGGSFGASPLRQEIGLGQAARIERVEIQWPSGGAAQILGGLEMDRHYTVKEGDPRPVPMTLRPLRLGARAAPRG